MDVRATIVLYPGVDDLDVFGPFEVLVNARLAGVPLEVELAGAHDSDPVHTSHGATILPQGVLEIERASELLVVPGGGWNDRARRGARSEAERGALPDAIRRWHAGGATIASVCTGAGVVAASGILEGRPVTTHRGARAELAAAGADVLDARVVDDGDILSAGGVTSGLDLALHLVERYFGRDVADAIALEIEYTRQGTVVFGPRSRRSGDGGGAGTVN